MRVVFTVICLLVIGENPVLAKKEPKAPTAEEMRKRAEEEKLKAAAEKHHENGVFLVKAGEYEQGCEELRTAISIHPMPVYYVHLGWCYVRLGKRDEAAQTFRNYASEIREQDSVRADHAMDLAELIDQLPALSVPAEVKKSARELWEFAVTVDIPDKRKSEQLKRMAEALLKLVTTDTKTPAPPVSVLPNPPTPPLLQPAPAPTTTKPTTEVPTTPVLAAPPPAPVAAAPLLPPKATPVKPGATARPSLELRPFGPETPAQRAVAQATHPPQKFALPGKLAVASAVAAVVAGAFGAGLIVDAYNQGNDINRLCDFGTCEDKRLSALHQYQLGVGTAVLAAVLGGASLTLGIYQLVHTNPKPTEEKKK